MQTKSDTTIPQNHRTQKTTVPTRRKKQNVILLFKILKASQTIARSLTPQTVGKFSTQNQQVNQNLNISVFAFIIQCFYKLLVNLYERKKARLYRQAKQSYKDRSYDHLPKDKWTNDYPIVLVHGFAGWAPDEGPFWGDYWSYLSDPDVIKHHQVYQADVGPFNSLHDRACELYQQIVGIVPFKAARNLKDNGADLARAVYGDSHFDRDHLPFQTYYKPRYLRQVHKTVDKIYGFPKGLPQGWSSDRKIHFIAHSQGAPTVRYLQYLLSIDYFALPGEVKVDKSGWVASVTALSGCHNGSLGAFASCINDKFLLKSDKRRFLETLPAFVTSKGYKMVGFAQNLVELQTGTQDVEPENIVKVFKQKPQTLLKPILVDRTKSENQDIMYEMGPQYGLLMDLNHERMGYNKRPQENHLEYINRLCENNYAEQSHDHAIPEFPPNVFAQRNILMKTHGQTFYFAISSGEKKQRFLSRKEYLTEPSKTSKMALGFDSDVIQNLKLLGSIRKIKRGGIQKMSTWDRIYAFFRCILNPLSIYHKLFLPNFTGYKQPRYLNNLFNPNMNNATAIDYANYDQTVDNDGVLSRYSTEYPRLSASYTSKNSGEAPWGDKSTPVRFDCWQETPLVSQHSCDSQTTLGGQTFQRGVWYYSGLELIDHHDLSGFENPWQAMETIVGRETRPQLLINTLNRLRTLDFSPVQTETEIGEEVCELVSVCQACKRKQKLQKDKVMDGEQVYLSQNLSSGADESTVIHLSEPYQSADVSIDSSNE